MNTKPTYSELSLEDKLLQLSKFRESHLVHKPLAISLGGLVAVKTATLC